MASKKATTTKRGKGGLEDLLQGLNEDLAGEYQAVLMYTTYAATVTGPHRPTLKSFFGAEVPEELMHAQFLADKIASLGGSPTTEPRKVPGAKTARQMLENVLAAERRAMTDYKARAKQAEAYGDKGLMTHLETIVEDETSHYEETEKILRGW
jgi:bacterioferritin